MAQVVEYEHEVFRGEVAAGTGRERGAAEPAGRGVEAANAVLERPQRVGKGGAAGVVQMEPEINRRRSRERIEHSAIRRGVAVPVVSASVMRAPGMALLRALDDSDHGAGW